MCSCILSLTSALDGVGGRRNAPAALLATKIKSRNHCLGGWVGPTGSAENISSLTGIRPLDRPARSQLR